MQTFESLAKNSDIKWSHLRLQCLFLLWFAVKLQWPAHPNLKTSPTFFLVDYLRTRLFFPALYELDP